MLGWPRLTMRYTSQYFLSLPECALYKVALQQRSGRLPPWIKKCIRIHYTVQYKKEHCLQASILPDLLFPYPSFLFGPLIIICLINHSTAQKKGRHTRSDFPVPQTWRRRRRNIIMRLCHRFSSFLSLSLSSLLFSSSRRKTGKDEDQDRNSTTCLYNPSWPK